MKKIMVLALAVALVGAFVMPVAALENEFGGYWRTRAVTQINFTGEDQTKAWDDSFVDSRTRLYYLAKINENLKLNNKFEINAAWGNQYGGLIGTDGRTIFRIKHSFADFTMDTMNFRVGLQDAVIGRGFLFNDDFAGVTATFKVEGVSIPFYWIKAYEGGKGSAQKDGDVDYYALAPSFKVNEMFTITPYVLWAYSDKASSWDTMSTTNPMTAASGTASTVSAAYALLHAPVLNTSLPPGYSASSVYPSGSVMNGTMSIFDRTSIFYFGLDLDAKFDMGNVWFTGIYQTGTADLTAAAAAAAKTFNSMDFQAYLTAIGAKADMGIADVHGQFFYASGSSQSDSADKFKAFFVPSPNDTSGQSYYWAEIMGYGIFDSAANVGESGMSAYNTSAHSCGDKISNIMAGNIGTTYKPMKDLSLTLDVWYAKLAQAITMTDAGTGVKSQEDYLGTEIDVVLTYELVKGLKMDLVGAYLIAGDATYKGPNQANPYELGTRLSLSF